MGLAASQARFLAITSRKMNCEFQSMQIAQQKLSVTRDLQKAAQDYQSSLNATKLVWDTTDTGIYDVSYDIMMTPSVLNEFDPFLITDKNGRVLLTQPMFEAAFKSGIIDEDGNPTGKTFELGADDPTKMGNDGQTILSGVNDGSRNAFLYQLGLVNQIDGSMVQKIINEGMYTQSGIGGPIYDKTTANALTTTAFINYMKTLTYGDLQSKDNSVTVHKDDTEDFDIVYSKDQGTIKAGDLKWTRGTKYTGTDDIVVTLKEYNSGQKADRAFTCTAPSGATAAIECTDTSGTTYAVGANIAGKQFKLNRGDDIPFDGIKVGFESSNIEHKSDDYVYGLNLVELLTNSSSGLCYTSKDLKSSSNAGKFYLTKNGAVVNEANAAKLTLGDLLSGKYELGFHESSSFNYRDAYTTVLKAIAETLGMNAGSEIKGLNVDTESNTALEQAFEFTKLLFNSCYTDNNSDDAGNLRKDAELRDNVVKGSNGIYSISLTNLLKSYLTNFAVALDGFGCGYTVSKGLAKDSSFVTDDLNYYFLIENEAAMTDTIMLNSDFYNMLYNQIATCGACTDKIKQEMVTDNDWLQQQLKRGGLFVSSLNNDGYYYQGAYTLNGHINEVKDEDAIARAELEYNVQKSKLNTKEESLELQMKNLDMEISSLTTEYDTVKNLISKSVEKVFTMFSS